MILCCYTELHDATRKSLEEYAPGAVLADVTGDAFQYWRTLEKFWGIEEDLVIIEHDIEIREDVIPQFTECPGDWCVFPYHSRISVANFIDKRLTTSLGCTKLSAHARAMASPREISQVGIDCPICKMGAMFEGLGGCWLHIDAKVAPVLEAKGIHPCLHSPDVTHHDWAVE